MNSTQQTLHYDMVVIGGGSGGMAAAKKAASYGAKVCLFDYVTPTIHGTKWGLGGTCVNVGCIPKKLMHYAALMGPILHHDAQNMGWNVNQGPKFDWTTLVKTVQNHIKSLNFSYRSGLRSAHVEYINAKAQFDGPNTLSYTLKNQEVKITTKYTLIATGGRPHIPEDVPGAMEFCYTSDDLFSLKHSPGKTLVVGGSYIALECAGFLTELGFDVTVAVRSILLRGFDRQCAEKVGALMKEMGTKFYYTCTPKSFSKLPNGKIMVEFNGAPNEEFDTVLFATGRKAETSTLNLESTGLSVEANNKIKANDEQTNIPQIFAVGDVLYGRPELTPVAIQAGELLASRLFGNAKKKMDYHHVPTAVFTPFEYGCVGLSEEEAIEKYGGDDVEVYLSEFTSLELGATHREKVESERADEFDSAMSPNCLSKLVCVKSQNEKVVGFHYVGPNAGEITQGMAIALRLGATKEDFDTTVGIHPTDAESFTALEVTKSSGESWVASGGCGGGKCG